MGFVADQPTSEKKSGFIPDAPTPEAKTEKPPTPIERIKEVGKEAGIGALAGTFAPEILSYGVAPLLTATGFGAPAAPFVFGAGQAMRGARLAGAVGGAISGAGSEVAGQAAKAKGATPVGEEASRLAGGLAFPSLARGLGTTVGQGLSSMLGRFVPGAGVAAKTIGAMLKEGGVEEANLTRAQKDFINKKIEDIRGGQPSLDAQKEIFEMLKGGATKIREQAKQQANALENQAAQIVQEAESAGGKITQDMEKRIANLRSQWDAAAEKVRADTSSEARSMVESGAKRSAIIRKNAEGQSASVRQIAEADANAAISQAKQNADKLLKDSEKSIAESQLRIEHQQRRLSNLKKTSTEFRAGETAKIGTPILPTELGTQVRTPFVEKLKNIFDTRATNTKPELTAWQNKITAKESGGQTYRQTTAYKNAQQAINSEIKDPATKLLIADPKSESQIRDVLNTINPKRELVDEAGNATIKEIPASVKMLDTLYRRLKDRASGIPAEGVDAIDQKLAQRLVPHIEKIIDEFSEGTYAAFKNKWRQESEPLNQFRSTLGKFVTDKPEGFDIGNYMERLSKVGDKLFDSKVTAQQFLSVAGPDEANRIAKGYLADQLSKTTPENIKNVLYKNRDWLDLDAFSGIKKQFESVAGNLEKAKTFEDKTAILEKALGTKLTGLPSIPIKEAGRIEEAGKRAAGAIETKARKQLTDIEKKAAEQLKMQAPATEKIRAETETGLAKGAAAVEQRAKEMQAQAKAAADAEKAAGEAAAKPLTEEAARIQSEAAKKVKTILGTETPAERVKNFLLGANDSEWQEVGTLLRETPGAKNKVAEAVSQIVADKASSSLKSAIEQMKYLGDRLVTHGLMDKPAVDALQSKLNEIFVMPISTAQKTTFAQRAVKDAITGYAIPGVVRGAEAGYKKLNK